MSMVRILVSLGWYLLPLVILGICTVVSGFPFVIFTLPFQTSWIAMVGLDIPRRIAPKWLLSRLECNLLNIDYVIKSIA